MDRRGFLGGSDLGVILGLSTYKTAAQLWCEKTGRADPEPAGLPAQIGHWLEPHILDMYESAQVEQVDWVRKYAMQHPMLPWARGEADAISAEGDVGVDAKVSTSPATWVDGVPGTYFAQAQWYMMLSGAARWDLAVLHLGYGARFEIMPIQRDDEVIEQLMVAACDFWALIESDTPPEPRNYDDVMRLFPQPEPQSVQIADPELSRTVDAYRALRAEEKRLTGELKLQMEELRDAISIAMLGSDKLVSAASDVLVSSVLTKGRRSLRIT